MTESSNASDADPEKTAGDDAPGPDGAASSPKPGAAAEPVPDDAPAAPEGEPSAAAPASAPGAGTPAPPPPGDVAVPAVPVATLPAPPKYRPNFVFLAVVSLVSLGADLASKAWAKGRLEDVSAFSERRVEIIKDHLGFVFARNRGGAWGLLQEENESIRKPFFLLISIAAILFIVSLYRRLAPNQRALKWGLPLVLGGALGNLIDRVRFGHVVDFIDFRADWMAKVNELISGPGASDHWPTFNIADIAICVGVGLMAVDMFTSRKPRKVVDAAPAPALGSAPPVAPAPPPEAAPAAAPPGEQHPG
jgi:signal peptidase II